MSVYYTQPGQPATTHRFPLTRRQAEILGFLRSYIAEHTYAPSFEEIAEHQGYSSLATVHEHLHNLERKGWIKRSYNESRAIEILPLVDADTLKRLIELRDLNARCEAADEKYEWTPEQDAVFEAHSNAFDGATLRWLIELAMRGAQ